MARSAEAQTAIDTLSLLQHILRNHPAIRPDGSETYDELEEAHAWFHQSLPSPPEPFHIAETEARVRRWPPASGTHYFTDIYGSFLCRTDTGRGRRGTHLRWLVTCQRCQSILRMSDLGFSDAKR